MNVLRFRRPSRTLEVLRTYIPYLLVLLAALFAFSSFRFSGRGERSGDAVPQTHGHSFATQLELGFTEPPWRHTQH